jgi:hypothetical protein
VGTLVRVPQLFQEATTSYAFRLAQTAMNTQGFADHGVDLRRSPLPVFGVADDVPFEFPLFQALAREVMRLGLDATSATRFVGLVSFQVVVLLWGVQLGRWIGAWAGVATAVLLELLPFGLLWGAAPLIDFFSVAVGLAMVLALERFMRAGSWAWLVAGAVAASLLFVVKVTTVPALGILLLVAIALLVVDVGLAVSWRRIVIALVVGPGLALLSLVLWTRHADAVKEASSATTFLTSYALHEWTFGTWAQRSDSAIWDLMFARVSGEMVGVWAVSLVLGLALALVLGDARHRIVVVGMALAAVAPVATFLNLYWRHDYYLSAVYPVICAIPVVGVAALAARHPRPRVVVPVAVVTAALMVSSVTTHEGKEALELARDPGPVRVLSHRLARVTPADAKVVVVGCDWNPTILYEAHRTGLMFRSDTRASRAWTENDIHDYDFIARCYPTLNPRSFLPPGYGVRPSGARDVFRIVTRG